MLTLLCLIFIGQSVASSIMIYTMPTMSVMNMQNQDMSMMSHHSTQATDEFSQMTSFNAEEDDCCSHECQCLVGSCSTVIAFFGLTDTSSIAEYSSRILFDNKLIAIRALTSLYRPPIFS